MRSVTEFTKEDSRDIKAGVRNKIFERFDNLGNIVEMRMYVRDTVLVQKNETIYNNNGRRTREDFYGRKDSLRESLTFDYDSVENIEIATIHWKAVKPYTQHITKYDKQGNILEVQYYQKNGSKSFFRIEFKRNDLLQIVERNDYRSDTIESWVHYNYNDNNLVSEELNHDGPSGKTNKYTYQYEYDSNKNWIKKITLTDDKDPKITTRKIEYY